MSGNRIQLAENFFLQATGGTVADGRPDRGHNRYAEYLAVDAAGEAQSTSMDTRKQRELDQAASAKGIHRILSGSKVQGDRIVTYWGCEIS